MLPKLTLLCAISLLLFTLTSEPAHAQTSTDVTSKIENLGNPVLARWPTCVYARNIWDLQTFQNKIYIGSGNSSNSAPCTNAGPVPIISYNPSTSAFTTEYTVSEEQINVYRIINGQLAVPGHDPRGDNRLSWYRLESGTWVKHVSPIDTVHIYDIAYLGTKLFVSDGGVYTALGSSDDGVTWPIAGPSFFRGYNLFQFNNKMYVSTMYPTNTTFNVPGLHEYDSTSQTFKPITSPSGQRAYQVMFPNQPLTLDVTPGGKLLRTEEFKQKLVYIGASIINDHQGDPFGLFSLTGISTTGITGAQKISLSGNTKPWDIVVNNGKLYVLGSIQNGTRYWVSVSSSSDLTTLTEEFRFDSPTYARSFEYLNGDFYFGLGTDTTASPISTGEILRYKVPATPNPSISGKVGDTDGDNDVDIFDYNNLLTDFGKKNDPATKSDLDNDDDVDIFDYNLLLSNFGK